MPEMSLRMVMKLMARVSSMDTRVLNKALNFSYPAAETASVGLQRSGEVNRRGIRDDLDVLSKAVSLYYPASEEKKKDSEDDPSPKYRRIYIVPPLLALLGFAATRTPRFSKLRTQLGC